MAATTPPVSKAATYPRDEIAKLLAPPEQAPGGGVRRHDVAAVVEKQDAFLQVVEKAGQAGQGNHSGVSMC